MKVPYFLPWISKEDKKLVSHALDQQWLTNGPMLKRFEARFSKYIGIKYAIGVGSATHALHTSVKSACRRFRSWLCGTI